MFKIIASIILSAASFVANAQTTTFNVSECDQLAKIGLTQAIQEGNVSNEAFYQYAIDHPNDERSFAIILLRRSYFTFISRGKDISETYLLMSGACRKPFFKKGIAGLMKTASKT